jgi:hypothetical protein
MWVLRLANPAVARDRFAPMLGAHPSLKRRAISLPRYMAHLFSIPHGRLLPPA